MAHFAELNENDVVLRVLVVSNSDMLDEQGQENEATGIAFLKQLFGETTRWVQTSYNNNIRSIFAGPGMLYYRQKDCFIQGQPYPSWTLDADTLTWHPPVPKPPGLFKWDEQTLSWIEIVPGVPNQNT